MTGFRSVAGVSVPEPGPGGGSSTPSVWRWATVEGTSPLGIRFDGDTAALDMVPESLVDPGTLVFGDRVWVQMYGRRVIVHGKAF